MVDLQTDEVIKRAARLVDVISPLLAGQGGDVQGTALVDLVAIHLAGHIVRGDDGATAEMREALLQAHIDAVRALIPVHERRTLATAEEQR